MAAGLPTRRLPLPYPFTAPNCIPFTICFCITTYTMIIGKTDIVIAAISKCVDCPRELSKNNIPIGSVYFSVVRNITSGQKKLL